MGGLQPLKNLVRHPYRRRRPGLRDLPDDFWELHARCHSETMTTPERLYGLHEAVKYIGARGIAGDIVECGVWRGGSAMMAALTLLQTDDTSRRLWLFDTFTGMAAPTEADIEAHTGRAARDEWQEGWFHASETTVRRNMAATNYPYVEYVKGKVEDTVPERVPERIALLRLDTDFYESTRHELEHLWPLIEPGGVLIVDDYGYWEGAKRAVDEFFATESVLLARLDSTGRMAVKTP